MDIMRAAVDAQSLCHLLLALHPLRSLPKAAGRTASGLQRLGPRWCLNRNPLAS